MRRPLIIGHRGFAGHFPHNSLEGVQAALKAGADGVEVDVRPTSDGVWVCHHDLLREGKRISQWRYQELAGFGIPALEAVLGLFSQDHWLFVEVKPLSLRRSSKLVEGLARQLELSSPKLLILSSSIPILALFKIVLPSAHFSWVMAEAPTSLPSAYEFSPHHILVERLLDLGRPLHPWTVNRVPRMRELAVLGVTSITTDFPDRALEVFGG